MRAGRKILTLLYTMVIPEYSRQAMVMGMLSKDTVLARQAGGEMPDGQDMTHRQGKNYSINTCAEVRIHLG